MSKKKDKNPFIIKTAILGILLIVCFSIWFFVFKDKNKENAKEPYQKAHSILTETEENNIASEKDSTPSALKAEDLTQEQLEGYYAVYKEPYVLFLRKALDAYLSGNLDGVEIAGMAIESRNEDGKKSGLDSFDKSYYQSKFVVITINNSIAGGKEIQIIFQDKPDKLFWVWIYQLAGEKEEYELRSFNDESPEKMEEINKYFEFFLKDKEHAL